MRRSRAARGGGLASAPSFLGDSSDVRAVARYLRMVLGRLANILYGGMVEMRPGHCRRRGLVVYRVAAGDPPGIHRHGDPRCRVAMNALERSLFRCHVRECHHSSAAALVAKRRSPAVRRATVAGNVCIYPVGVCGVWSTEGERRLGTSGQRADSAVIDADMADSLKG